MNKILFLLMTVMAICTQAQNVLRGPYLQQSTDQSIRVKWRTDVATQSKIWYGLSPNNFTDSIYTSSLVSNHEILITGLSPFTKYYYKIGNANGKHG